MSTYMALLRGNLEYFNVCVHTIVYLHKYNEMSMLLLL